MSTEKEDFLKQVEDGVANGYTVSMTRTMDMIRRGELTYQEYEAAAKKGYAVLYPQLVGLWKDGQLFTQQGYDFLSCLMAGPGQVAQDQSRWAQVEAAAQALGENVTRSAIYFEIKSFYLSRVAMDFPTRRSYLSQDGRGLAHASTWTEAKQRNFAKLRDGFNAETAKWGWKQPFDREAKP